jgi:tight adherence protein C
MAIEQYGFLWLALGLVILTIAAAIAWKDPATHRINSRVAELEDRFGRPKKSRSKHRPGAGAVPSLVARIASLTPALGDSSATLPARLARGGMYHPSSAPMFRAVQTLLTIVPLAVAIIGGGFLHWPLTIAGGVGAACAAIGWLAPIWWLERAVAGRHLLLRRSLPDFLDLMIVCLQGGLSVQETIRRVGDELRLAHPVLAGELSIVQRDVELGATVDNALRRFATRSGYEGVRTLSSFVRESQKFGTQLTEALRLHADMLRLQREEAAEEKAQRAAVAILLPTLLLIFPAVFVVLVGPALIQIQEAFAAK